MLGATPDPHASIDKFITTAQNVEARGFSSLWLAHIRGHDAVMAMALAGRETSRIEVGTAVTPIQPRHPAALAQQALSASVIARNRFTLGVGLSHKVVIEDMLGLAYARPARTMREYLSVLVPLLAGESARFDGDIYRTAIDLNVGDTEGSVPVIVAALGPKMLEVAGAMSDGTALWMTGPRTIEKHVVPLISAAAGAQGRASPRILAGFPLLLTNDETQGREIIAKQLSVYGTLPAYRAMLDREGVAGPADLALVGGERELARAIDRIAESGATELLSVLIETGDGSALRTLDFLQSRLV